MDESFDKGILIGVVFCHHIEGSLIVEEGVDTENEVDLDYSVGKLFVFHLLDKIFGLDDRGEPPLCNEVDKPAGIDSVQLFVEFFEKRKRQPSDLLQLLNKILGGLVSFLPHNLNSRASSSFPP